MTRSLWLITAYLTLSFCLQANGSVVVLRDDGSPAGPALAEISWNPLAGGWDITLLKLYNPGGETIYKVYGTGGETINSLIINVPCWKNSSGECAPAGSPVYVSVLHGDAGGIRTIRRIIQTNDAETVLLRAEAREDIGEIVVESMSEIYAERDVLGPIIATTEDNSARGIFTVDADRNILGDIKAPNGRVAGVRAKGSIGRPGAPITIEAKYIIFGIHSLTGTYAHINTRVNGGTAGIWNMSGPIFEGSLITAKLAVNTFEGLPPRLIFTERFSADLIVGSSFNTLDGWIELPRGGFDGRIIFNADNLPGGTWVNPVFFGTSNDPDRIEISEAGYPQDAQMLGGGSIGLVPFRLHNVSCSPPNGASINADTVTDPLNVRLRHYGPISWTAGDPVTIEQRVAGSIGVFTPLSMLDFGIQIALDDPNSLVIGLNASGQGGFEPGFEYRILPTEFLRCAVSSEPNVQWDLPYLFTFRDTVCVGDTNGTQSIDVSDLLFLLSFWGPVFSFGDRVDFNGDGAVNVSDLLTLLANWGPCP